MTNMKPPERVWIFDNGEWNDVVDWGEAEVVAHFKKCYDEKIHDHMTEYTLSSTVQSRIQLALLGLTTST